MNEYVIPLFLFLLFLLPLSLPTHHPTTERGEGYGEG